MSTTNSLHAQLVRELLTRYSLHVSQTWIAQFLASARTPVAPLPALASTAHFRILNSDITTCLSSDNDTALLPPDVANVQVKELRLPGPVAVQVLDIQDVGTSKWSQVEAIQRVERGEEVHGREVIRSVPSMGESEGSGDNSVDTAAMNATTTSTASTKSFGPHTLVLQDAMGTKVTAFELVRIPKIAIGGSGDGDGGMCIGCKLLLKGGTVVNRGMVMLRPENVVVLGGKIEVWDKKWRQGRKARLTREVEEQLATSEADRTESR